jgi:transcription initiation factor TFIIIB Brf1 subunit/transcription initiation factor TFIIB
MIDLDSIWSDFDNANISQQQQQPRRFEVKMEINLNNDKCKGCGGTNIHQSDYENVCYDCGLVSNEDRLSLQPTYENNTNGNTSTTHTSSNSRIAKMQEWYMWTNEEKNIYKLKNYIKELCTKLQIVSGLVPSIVDTCVFVMEIIKKHDGTKRAKVKDGIILVCIQYVSQSSQVQYSSIQLAKKLHLDIKYITKAEKTILELVNAKKLNLDKMTMLQTKTPFDYVMDVIVQKDLKIQPEILKQVELLIKTCEENDLLLDHTPLSVGVCCFYYILKLNDIQIDLKVFSELYNLSVVTVVKTYNKLKTNLLGFNS